MQKEMLDQMTSFSKSSIKPIMTLNTIASRAFERAAKQSLEILNDNIATSVNYLQSFANSKKAEDVVALQTQVIKDSGAKAINYAQKALETIVDTSAELSKWFEDGLATMVSTANVSDKKVATATGKA